MKATKKIVGATAALVAAVALSAGSTFAWFTANDTVSATGLSVDVTTVNNLLISDTTGGTFAASATMTDANISKQSLSPASTVGVTSNATPTFYKLDTAGSGTSYDNSTAGSGATFETTTEDYAWGSVFVKVDGDTDGSNLYVSEITPSSSSVNIDNALRIMFVVHEAGSTLKSYIYAPVGTHDGSNVGIKDTDGTTDNVTYCTTGQAGTVILSSLTKNTEYQIDVYVWYEGTDENCTAKNATDAISTAARSISFKLAINGTGSVPSAG